MFRLKIITLLFVGLLSIGPARAEGPEFKGSFGINSFCFEEQWLRVIFTTYTEESREQFMALLDILSRTRQCVFLKRSIEFIPIVFVGEHLDHNHEAGTIAKGTVTSNEGEDRIVYTYIGDEYLSSILHPKI